jgi:uncharacterized protein YcaQ
VSSTRPRRLSRPQARRIALAAQGFTDSRPSGRANVAHLRRVMDRLTILQLDSVNVLCRSHYLPFLARLGSYDRDKLDRMLYHSGDYLEFLSHEASITHQRLQPILRQKSRHWNGFGKIMRDHPDYVEAVFEEVAANGPLSVSDLDDPGKRTGEMWGWSKGKLALESLHVVGRLSISERTSSFVTLYDLPERVIQPEILAQPTPDTWEAKREMVRLGARSHGIGTAACIADYFRLKLVETRKLLAELEADGEVVEVAVDGWDAPAYLHREATKPRSVTGAALLSPFDPVVWFRPRAEALFDFHYRIEIYVPAAKRQFGYYVLPFLLDGELVGRVDLKADRKADGGAGRLLVRGVYAEETVDDEPVDRHRVAAEMFGRLTEMADWLGLADVEIGDRGNLAGPLRAVS